MAHTREGKVGQSQFESCLRGLLPECEETQGQGSVTVSTWDLIFILLMWACTSSSAGMSQFLPWEACLRSHDPLSLPSPSVCLLEAGGLLEWGEEKATVFLDELIC